MKLGKVRETRDYFSKELSGLVRNLGFAGIGVVFAFTLGQGQRHVPWTLAMASLFIVLSLVADFAHYVTGTLYWQWRQDSTERRLQEERGTRTGMNDEEDAGDTSDAYLSAIEWLFRAKVSFMTTAYVFVLVFLWRFAF